MGSVVISEKQTEEEAVVDAIQEAWANLSDAQVVQAGKAFPVFQQLKTLLGAFGYWHPPASLW
jgi:hypothetical protein